MLKHNANFSLLFATRLNVCCYRMSFFTILSVPFSIYTNTNDTVWIRSVEGQGSCSVQSLMLFPIEPTWTGSYNIQWGDWGGGVMVAHYVWMMFLVFVAFTSIQGRNVFIIPVFIYLGFEFLWDAVFDMTGL